MRLTNSTGKSIIHVAINFLIFHNIMQIEVNNKTVVTVLAAVVIAGVVFAGFKAINKNIGREGSETRKEMANKKDITDLTANLDAKMTQLSAKMDEMNKQMTTAQTTPDPAETIATTTTDSASAEEEILAELGNDIEDMKDIQEDAVNALNDINDTTEDLVGAIEGIAANAGNMTADINTLIIMATQSRTKSKVILQQADRTINQYAEKVTANENVLIARQDLFTATRLGDDRNITSAESKLVSTLNTSGSKLSPAFAEQYFKQVPTSFGKISGMDSALDGIKAGGAKFDFSKMNFSKPSAPSTSVNRSLDTTTRR